VKFHDGTPLNAAAVKFTYDRALKGTPPRAGQPRRLAEGAEVVDNLTVDIVTREPYGPVLRTLAMYCMGIVSPAAVGKLARTSAGRRWDRAVQVRGVEDQHPRDHRALPGLLGDKALLDRVIFKVVPEEGARMIALQTGRDMVRSPRRRSSPRCGRTRSSPCTRPPGSG